jgi:EAL domain-containing protein (putative c-di-GMP-specific phosphodiesterase class I)
MLRAMQCDGLQGWHVSRPMPAEPATQWLLARVGTPAPDRQPSRLAG